MTVPAPVKPGAIINIKLSAEAAANAAPAFSNTLGTHVQTLLSLHKQDLSTIAAGGVRATGKTLSFKNTDGHIVRFTGINQETPVADQPGMSTGSLLASLATVAMPGLDASSMQGEMKYSYVRIGEAISSASILGRISSYQYRSLEAARDPVFGTAVTGFTGDMKIVDSLEDVWSDGAGMNYLLSGTLGSLTYKGSQLLKSSTIIGNLDIKAYEQSVPMINNALNSSTPSLNITLVGSISSYNARFYDGSYIQLSTGTPIQASRETSVLTALSHADNWAGDDRISIILPDHIEQSININSGAGNDTVIAQGSDGELTIDTGAGDDLITLLDDQPILRTGEGIDTLRAGFSEIDMNRYTGLENLVFTGKAAEHIRGNELANQITGGKGIDTIDGDLGDDVLHGLAGNDRLFGSSGNDFLYGDAGNDYLVGGEGSDAMYGGAGNDIYVVDGGEIVSEARSATNDADSGGIDEVRAWITYKLGADLEKLTLLGEAHLNGTGNAKANSLTGNGGRNTLRGEAGNDFLDGKAGDDRLYGGAGNDTLWGNEGNDQLYGDEGIDVMWGGSGDDVYLVDHLRDRVSEAVSATDSSDAGGTDDTVYSSVSFVLADRLEHLIMRDSANPISGTGNAANNIITGNSGDNLIDGKGGIDDLNGANGSDIYLIRAADEHSAAEFNDKGFEGTDEVRFSPTASPAVAGTPATAPRLKLFEGDMGIERVVIGTGTGKEAITSGKIAADIDASAVQSGLTLVGNAGVNTLIGTGFNDTFIGNRGADILTGGAGDDRFVFTIAPAARTAVDTITDFGIGDDALVLRHPTFATIGPAGNLADTAFTSGAGMSSAQEADDRIIFDTQSGKLYFDRDGSGISAAVLIGVLMPGTQLSASDIKIADVI